MFKDNCFFEEKYSSIIKVTGSDKFNFLQGIISNDTKILKTNLSLYSAILTPQGKFLTDFILSLHNESILIEVRNKNLDMFMKKLSMFKLRSNVSFEIISDLKIYLLNHDNLKLLDNVKNKKILDDPRFNNFFARVYIFWSKRVIII